MSATRPNIIFIFADDWGWGDLGCYGHAQAMTPHLDQLARDGRLFSQFYVCSGVCSPSRAAVMTGKFPGQLGIHGHFAEHERNASRGMPNWLEPSVVTLPGLLQSNGYRTGHFGKWHLGHGPGAPEPFNYGIDECAVTTGNGPKLSFGGDTGELFDPALRHRSSEVIIDETISFVDRSYKENSRQPVYVNVWLNDTHAILHPSEEQLEPYQNIVRPELRGIHWGANAIYYAALTNADYHIGRLLQYLDNLGIADDTIVIFSADNGPEDISIGNAAHSGVGSPGPFRGRKRSLYEGGVRTPFIIRWPSMMTQRGIVDNDTVLCAVDLLPSLCRVADVSIPENLLIDGEDQSDAFCSEPMQRVNPLLWQWRFSVAGHTLNKSPMLSIRDGDWKLLMNPDRNRMELFNVPSDPMELNNLVNNHSGIVDNLAQRVAAWAETLPAGPMDDDAGINSYPWPK